MPFLDEDPSLFEAFRNGSRDAFKFYFDKYAGLVREFILNRTGDAEAAKEKTLEAFTLLYKNREAITDKGHLLGFLYTTAKNFCYNYQWDKEKKQHLQDDLLYLAAEQEDTYAASESELIRDETLLALRTSWKKLSPRKRRIIVLYYFHELSTHAIAARLKIRRQTVLNHLSQSIVLLRKDLNGDWEENNPAFT